MTNPPTFTTILLAAGESRRMGRPKLFLPLADGTTLLRKAVLAAVELGKPVVIVTGAYASEIHVHLADLEGLTYAHNPRWREGMSSSIAAGVKAALDDDPAGFLFTLADQPGMDAPSLRRLVEAFSRNRTEIVATRYPERLGVPAIFPARYAAQLLDGTGTNGARQLIAAAPQVNVVEFPHPPPGHRYAGGLPGLPGPLSSSAEQAELSRNPGSGHQPPTTKY